MTGLLESAVRKLSFVWGPRQKCPLIQPGYEEVPRVWPFNTADKADTDVSELLSMHCSWCVLDCDEAHRHHAFLPKECAWVPTRIIRSANHTGMNSTMVTSRSTLQLIGCNFHVRANSVHSHRAELT